MKPQFLYDEKGNEAFVLLDAKTYRKLLDDLEDQYLDDIYKREKPIVDAEIRAGNFLTIQEFKAARAARKKRNGRNGQRK